MTKNKPIYSVKAGDDVTATATYSCLKTLCQEWGVLDHYSTIWKHLNYKDLPYQDSNIIIKKHTLIKSEYKQTKPNKRNGKK